MESFFSRYRNASLLVVVLFAQVIGLAMQVKRTETGGAEAGGTRLLRVWVVNAISPLEKFLVGSSHGVRDVWRNYAYLRGLRRENRDLREQVEQLRIEQVRLSEDAAQARRLQALLGFKEKFISKTLAAQVIGSSGSEQSHVVYIDKGASDGVKPDMAVITPDGIVGKVLRVYHGSSQVLLINDPDSGVGAILQSSRLQGILRGTAAGEVMLKYVMSDEKVAPGDPVLTSGGDRIFPKGLPIGTVQQTNPGSDLFLNIRVKPAADLSRLEEVLVVTTVVESTPSPEPPSGTVRAADILAERLPSVPPKTATAAAKPAAANNAIPGSGTAAPTAPSQAASGDATTKAAATAPNPGASPDATISKPAAQPTNTNAPAAEPARADTTTQPAVVKPAVNKPATSGDAAKPKPTNSAGQPPKPAVTPPPTQPGEEVSR